MSDGQKDKDLELVQGVVNRPAFVLLAYIPVFVFWGLDGYIFWKEKKFRKLYDYVRQIEEAEIDFPWTRQGSTTKRDLQLSE